MAQPGNRIVMDLGEVKIDADPVILARLIHDLVNNKPFRKVFEADPVAALRGAGINVPEEHASQITATAIDKGLAAFKERGTEAIAPGVAVMVDVATEPAVSAGVQAGVNSAVATAVIASEKDPVKAAEARRSMRLKALGKKPE